MSPVGDCGSIWLLDAERHGYWWLEIMTVGKSLSVIWQADIGSVVVNRIRVWLRPFRVQLRKFVTHDHLGFHNQIFVNFFIGVAKDLLVHDFLIFLRHFWAETCVDSELSQRFQVVLDIPAISLERCLWWNGLMTIFPRGTICKISILTRLISTTIIVSRVADAPNLGLLFIQPRAAIPEINPTRKPTLNLLVTPLIKFPFVFPKLLAFHARIILDLQPILNVNSFGLAIASSRIELTVAPVKTLATPFSCPF